MSTDLKYRFASSMMKVLCEQQVRIGLAAVFAFLISQSYAQPFQNGFNFYLSSSDTSSQRFLPTFPKAAIGDSAFVGINADGKFSVHEQRIRFWGVNAAADAAFPSPAINSLLAGRLRKFGVNIVRMHHLDNPWSSKSLLGSTSTRSLNAANLDLLERYIAALKENGIYVNMNLHVSRTFRVNDGVAEYDSLPEFGKCVNFFDPYIISLHKEYARQLLTHLNPHTGKALVHDPVMAMVEISNENSLYRNWRDNKLKPIGSGGFLPVRYSRMLDSLWVNHVANRYQSTAALRAAWDVGLVAPGAGEQIVNGGFESGTSLWTLEVHAPASGTYTRDPANPRSGSFSGRVTVTNSTGIDWNIQLKQPTATVRRDSFYTVTFAARADAPRTVSVSLINDASPYTWYGGRTVSLSTSWQVFTFSVRATEENIGHTRLSFAVGAATGTYWFDDVSMTKAAVNGLLPGESLEARTIARMEYAECVSYSNPRVKDLSAFYVSLERNYFAEMTDFLKNTLGVRVPIVGTNWNVGPADLAAMSDADYLDNHGYWDHPSFPNEPWSQTDWLIWNRPMVKENINSTIPPLFAGVPRTGKPFTVSEYNHPNPNQYQVESILLSTGYAAFNDADAFMFFAYDEPVDWGVDRMSGFFGINRNSVLMSFFPTASLAFRNGYIRPSVQPIVVQYTSDTLNSLPRRDAATWYGPSFYDRRISLTHAVKTSSYFAASTTDFGSLPPAASSPYRTDTDEILWNTSDGVMSIAAEKVSAAAGYLAVVRNQRIGAMTLLDFPSSGFGSVTWVSLTDSGLTRAERSLITVGSKTQNTGLIWNADSTSIANNWGTAPTVVSPLNLQLDLNVLADSLRIFPLNSLGQEGNFVPITVRPSSGNHFTVVLDQYVHPTIWFGIEKYGNGIPLGVGDPEPFQREFLLGQNYPNPFNPTTSISFSIPSRGVVSLKVYDVVGREVATIISEELDAGRHVRQWSAVGIASGVFIYKLYAGGRALAKKMLILR